MLRQHRKYKCRSASGARAIARLAYRLLPLLSLLSPVVSAENAGFSGGVTPSRFELDVNSGEVLRRSLKIYNLSTRPAQFAVRTVDWHYSESGSSLFRDELSPDSCRPWVRLERHRVSVVPDPQRPRNFRFEIEVPDGVADRECRFAIMVEGLSEPYAASFADGAMQLPITGRIAVIVYLKIGDVEPQLQIGDIAVKQLDTGTLPALEVRNVGGAHGRLDADLLAISDTGQRIRLALATSPVLPGQTRFLAMTPERGKSLEYPLNIIGKIYADGQALEIDQPVYAPASLLARD